MQGVLVRRAGWWHVRVRMKLPAPPHWVYLDTNVLIDLAEVFSGWRPPPGELTKTDRQKVAAARIRFYGYRDRCGWFLVVSGDGRAELMGRGAPDWTLSVFLDMDEVSDSLPPTVVAGRASELERGGIESVDARHLARAELTPWIRIFVTNDKKLVRKGRAILDDADLAIVTAVEAEELLGIEPGERPPVAPAEGSPLRDDQWWVPPG